MFIYTFLIRQMAKNKGLTPKRKKIDRNPRVKYREKFRRAKIRRKGQVSTHLMSEWHVARKLSVRGDIQDLVGRSERFDERRPDTVESCRASVQASKRASSSSNPMTTGASQHVFVEISPKAHLGNCFMSVCTTGVHTVNKSFKKQGLHLNDLRQTGSVATAILCSVAHHIKTARS